MAIKKKTDLADQLGVTEEELTAPQSGSEGAESLEIDLDFGLTGSQEFPSGTYHAVLEAMEGKQAMSGNSMIVWRIRTIKEKRAFWVNTVLTKDAQWKVTETAVACGAKGEGKVRLDVASLIGNCCRLVVEQQMYEGTLRPNVKKVLPPNQETLDIYALG